MHENPIDDDTSSIAAFLSRVPPESGKFELCRTLFAVNDAGNLADALGANLEHMANLLASAAFGDDVRERLFEGVELCRQLTKLMGGAIGSCRAASRPTIAKRDPIPVVRLMDRALAGVARQADAMGVLILSEGPGDLCVAVDGDLMRGALETLLIHLARSAPHGGVIHARVSRCGGHAVIGLTCDGPGVSNLPLERLYCAGVTADLELESRTLSAKLLAGISNLLSELGGYLDAETRADGDTTLYIVLPACPEVSSVVGADGTVLAREAKDTDRNGESLGQKRSEKMIVQSDRFGAIEVDSTDVLSFPTGIIGFPEESAFVLVRKSDSHVVAWLQSTKNSYLALPVVSAHVLASQYPDVAIEDYADRIGLGRDSEELAVLAVLSAPPGQAATVNLMAPIIVNATTRVGAQVMLEGTRFTTRELFVIAPQPTLDLTNATAMPDPAQSSTSAAE